MKLVIQSCDGFDAVMGRELDAEKLKVYKPVCSNFSKYESTIILIMFQNFPGTFPLHIWKCSLIRHINKGHILSIGIKLENYFFNQGLFNTFHEV